MTFVIDYMSSCFRAHGIHSLNEHFRALGLEKHKNLTTAFSYLTLWLDKKNNNDKRQKTIAIKADNT